MDRIEIITAGYVDKMRVGAKDYESVVNERIEKIEERGGEIVGIDYITDSDGYLKNIILWYEIDSDGGLI